MTTYYLGTHRSQYDGSAWANSNCLPTSVANGLRSTTGGRINLSGGQMRALVARAEEQNPTTPGWSLADANLAVSRIGPRLGYPNVPDFLIHSGSFAALEADRAAGRFVVVPGDSDRFPDGTCSGVYDGPHAVGLHPNGAITLGDPICPSWRTEMPAVIRAYAEKLAGGTTLRWGTFAIPVPEIGDEMHYAKTRTLLAAPNPRAFAIPANVLVNGYDPNKPGVVVRSFKSANPSSAAAVADASVAWYNPDGSSATAAPIPRGSGFLEVAPGTAGGVLAGLLIVRSLVTLGPAAPAIGQAQLDAARAEGKAIGAAAVKQAAIDEAILHGG